MSIASRIESITEHIEDTYNTFSLSNTTIDFNKNIENIPQGIRKSYLDIMNNGIQMVWDNWEKVVGTGTTLTLTNTEYAEMKFDYKGNTSQEGTPTPEAPQPIHTVSGDNTIKVENKNLTLKNVKGYLGNSSVLVDNGSESFVFYATEGETYTFSSQTAMNRGQYAKVETLNIVNNTPITNKTSISVLSSYNSASFTCSFTGYCIVYVNSTKNDAIGETFQIEKGSSPTSYAAHTEASYSINLKSSNLLEVKDPLIANRYNAGTSVAVANQKVFLAGTTSTTKRYFTSNDNKKAEFEKGTYTLSTNFSEGIVLQIRKNSAPSTVINVTDTFTVDEDFYITNGYFVLTNGNTYAEEIWIKLEKGSQVTPYEKYYEPIELCKIGDYRDRIFKSTGKNLFDKDSFTYTTGWYNDSGVLQSSTGTGHSTNYIQVESNKTYTISGFSRAYTDNPVYTVGRIYYWDSSKNWISRSDSTTSTSMTFTIPENCKYITLQVNIDSGAYRNILSDLDAIQLELGQETSYEPYGEPKWYLYKAINKKVFTNEDAFSIASNYTTSNRTAFGITIDDIKGISSGNETPNLLSTKFRSVSMNTTWAYSLMSMTNYAGQESRVYFFLQANKTIEDIQNVLVGEPFYYALKTPTYTEITDSILLSQLEAIKRSYEGQTNINQENNNLPFELSAEALEGNN